MGDLMVNQKNIGQGVVHGCSPQRPCSLIAEDHATPAVDDFLLKSIQDHVQQTVIRKFNVMLNAPSMYPWADND